MPYNASVWVIADGDGYTFHGICHVFSTKEKAEAFLEKWRDRFSQDNVCIYEEELDPT